MLWVFLDHQAWTGSLNWTLGSSIQTLSLTLAPRNILRNSEVQEGDTVLNSTGVFAINILFPLMITLYRQRIDSPTWSTKCKLSPANRSFCFHICDLRMARCSWDHSIFCGSCWLRDTSSTNVGFLIVFIKNMFLVHQVRFHCFARPNVYVRNDQSSSVPKNVCSFPGEKLGGWFKFFCQWGHEKKNSEVDIKLVMSVKSTSTPWGKKMTKDGFPAWSWLWGPGMGARLCTSMNI